MVMKAIRLLGLAAIAGVCTYRLVTLALNTRSWQVLLPPETRPKFPTLLRLRWIGESVNNLLPVAQVGGDLARAWLVSVRGVPRPDAMAAMVVDLGTGIATQVVFGISGALALAHMRLLDRTPPGMWTQLIVGLGLAGLVVVMFFLLLRFGVGRLATRVFSTAKARGHWARLSDGLIHLDDAVKALIAREHAIVSSFGWHLVAWLSQVGETWILLTSFGVPVSLRTALAIEGLSSAARGAVFFVPGGVGIQELTIVSVCRFAGLDMQAALALGLAKRAREIILGVPGLVAWALEKPWWWRRKQRPSASESVDRQSVERDSVQVEVSDD